MWKRLGLAAAVVLGVSGVASWSAVSAFDDDDVEARRELIIKTVEASIQSSRARVSVLGDFDHTRASAYDLKVARALRSKKATLTFESAHMDDVLEALRDVTGVTFVCSAKVKKHLEETKPQIDFRVSKLSVENILNLLASRLRTIRFQVRYGAVLVLHVSEYRPHRVRRVYNINDLLRRRTNFRAPRLGLHGLTTD